MLFPRRPRDKNEERKKPPHSLSDDIVSPDIRARNAAIAPRTKSHDFNFCAQWEFEHEIALRQISVSAPRIPEVEHLPPCAQFPCGCTKRPLTLFGGSWGTVLVEDFESRGLELGASSPTLPPTTPRAYVMYSTAKLSLALSVPTQLN